MRHVVVIVLAVGVLASIVAGQGLASGPLEGVWKSEEVVIGTGSTGEAQTGLYIFTRSHYGFMNVVGSDARRFFAAPNGPTNDEKIAAYDTFSGSSGKYEVSGSTLTIIPIVAKSPNFMVGGSQRFQFQIEQNTLWLTTSGGTSLFNGVRVLQGPTPASPTRRRLTRIGD